MSLLVLPGGIEACNAKFLSLIFSEVRVLLLSNKYCCATRTLDKELLTQDSLKIFVIE